MIHRSSEARLFATSFLRDPYMLGSILPSSRFLVDTVLSVVDWHRARVIVEYGPGVGTFTSEILRRMRSDAILVSIETNLEFVRFLGSRFTDTRLVLEHDSAQNVRAILTRHGVQSADCIISGIPLGSMPKALQVSVAVASGEILVPAGELLVYQFTSRTLPVLRQVFGDVRRRFVLRNFPPAQLFVCSNAAGECASTSL